MTALIRRVRTTDSRTRELAPVVLLVGLAFVVLGALAVLPARTWMSQRANLASTSAELEQVETEVESLQAELDLLQTDAEIERQARENFNLVYPGEESYRILPPGDGTGAVDGGH